MFENMEQDHSIQLDTQTLDSDEFRHLPIDIIDPDPHQPRIVFEPGELEALADTIRARRVVQPIQVTPIDNGRFMIIDGERRWRASKIAQQQTIPAIIKCHLSESEREDMQLLSFFSRVDLNPVELAQSLEAMIAKRDNSAKAVSEELGVSESWISQRRKILRLPADVQQLAMDGIVTDKAALNKLGALADKERQHTIEQIRTGQLNSSDLSKPSKKKASQPVKQDPNIVRLEQALSEQIGAPVTIQHNPDDGTGAVRFQYSNLDLLEQMLAWFQNRPHGDYKSPG